MNDQAVHSASDENVEAMLRNELARGDAMAQSVLPILRHLVLAQDNSALGDDILARVRGMVGALAEELAAPLNGNESDRIRAALIDSPALLAHLHAAAFEWQLVERLQDRLAIDPVWSPLLQAAVASPEPPVKADALAFLAAQARWCRSQRSMTMAVGELPAELVHEALLIQRAVPTGIEAGIEAGIEPGIEGRARQAEAALRQAYDEGTTRLALAARLLTGLGTSDEALSVANSGVSLFLSALALRTGQERDRVVGCCHDAQVARLMLMLSSAGLPPSGIGEAVLSLHPDGGLPAGLEHLARDLAAAPAGIGPQGAGA